MKSEQTLISFEVESSELNLGDGSRRVRKLEYMSHYNARDDVKQRAQDREKTPKYKAMRKLYRDKKRAIKQGLTPSQIAARLELGMDLSE